MIRKEPLKHAKNGQHVLGPILCSLLIVSVLTSCQSSTYYTRQLPVYTVEDVEAWQIIDSLIISNRSCDRFDRGRRFVWVMIWERMNTNTFKVLLVENRVIFNDAFGCVFLGGEPVVLQGDTVKGLLQKTETTVELKTDIIEDVAPENASSWWLSFADDYFTITLSEAMPCWKLRDPPSDP